MFKKTYLSLVLVFAVLLSATGAWAGVAALSYTDTNNTAVTVAPSQRWINPTGELSFYLTAGLERKVGYVLLDGSGQTVAEGVSAGAITASEHFTVLGQTYYGKVLNMPASLSEGDYTLKARILDGQGQLVSEDSVALSVDLTPPTAGGIWWDNDYYNNYITGNELVSAYPIKNLFAKEVSDTAGIDRVQFESFNPAEGSAYYSVPAWYTASTSIAGIGTGVRGSVAQGVHLPIMDGLLGVRFIVYDKAGNKTIAETTAKYNGTHEPLAELVAIYNPNVTTEFLPGSGLVGYEAYTPGMTTYANPMRLLYRLPRSNWVDDNPDYGLNAYNAYDSNPLAYTNAQYAYFRIIAPHNTYGYLDSNYWRFNSPQWWSSQVIRFDLKLADTAPQGSVKLIV